MIRRFRWFAVLTLLFATAAAAAADESNKAVFISRESIEVAARETALHPPPTLHFDFGEVVYQNRYGRAKFAYLPFLRTLPYTFPAPNWNQIPNPLNMTSLH